MTNLLDYWRKRTTFMEYGLSLFLSIGLDSLLLRYIILRLVTFFINHSVLTNMRIRFKEMWINKAKYDNLIIKVDGVFYSAVDRESLSIISPSFESWMGKHLDVKQGDNVIDLGAHVGKYSLSLSKKIGSRGLLIALEASPINYLHLKRGVILNAINNVIPINLAAWNENEEIKLYRSNKGGQHSAKEDLGEGTLQVKAVKVDSLVKKLGLNSLEWIKIDVEGAEVEVLEGAKNTIRKFRPKIIIEVMPYNTETVLKILKRGYRVNNIGSESDYAYNFKAIPKE